MMNPGAGKPGLRSSLISLIGDDRSKNRRLAHGGFTDATWCLLLELLLAVIAVSKGMQGKILTLRLERQQV